MFFRSFRSGFNNRSFSTGAAARQGFRQQPFRILSQQRFFLTGAAVAGLGLGVWNFTNPSIVKAEACCPGAKSFSSGGGCPFSGQSERAIGKTCDGAHTCCQGDVDYDEVRKAIVEVLDANEDVGMDGIGPVILRLAWHTSGTYNKDADNGGSDGCTIRFAPEINYGANAGLGHAQTYLEPVKRKFPNLSYADLYTLAGVVAIEEMGGPVVNWRPGRCDAKDGSACQEDGRLPDGAWTEPEQIRKHFNSMGLNDREMVALIGGGHALGRCHADRSGFIGPWTDAPTTFSNMFFTELLNSEWVWNQKPTGNWQYNTPDMSKMMLPADMALTKDEKFLALCKEYAENPETLRKDFAAAFQKLEELGCKNLQGVAPATPYGFAALAPVALGVALSFLGGK